MIENLDIFQNDEMQNLEDNMGTDISSKLDEILDILENGSGIKVNTLSGTFKFTIADNAGPTNDISSCIIKAQNGQEIESIHYKTIGVGFLGLPMFSMYDNSNNQLFSTRSTNQEGTITEIVDRSAVIFRCSKYNQSQPHVQADFGVEYNITFRLIG